MKTAEVICSKDDPTAFRKRAIRCVWKGGHLVEISRELYTQPGFLDRLPWRIFRLWYRRKYDTYLCWRLDWITMPNDVLIPE